MGLPTIYLNIRIVEWHMEKHMRHMNIVQWTKFTCLMDIILYFIVTHLVFCPLFQLTTKWIFYRRIPTKRNRKFSPDKHFRWHLPWPFWLASPVHRTFKAVAGALKMIN